MLNKFNQVGLCKLIFQGQSLGNYELSNIYNQQPAQKFDQTIPKPNVEQFQIQNSLRPRNLKIQTVQEELFDTELLNKLKLLQSKKDAAVRSEDYDLAMALKEISDKLKILGHKLL